MLAPVKRLKHQEIVWLSTRRCRHGHSFLEHWTCYEKNPPKDSPLETNQERIGYFDIESSDLNAEFGYVFSYAILDDSGKVCGRVLTPEEILSNNFDRKLMAELAQDLKEFDRLVVYWGKSWRFDIPMVRSRCEKYHVPFPKYREMWVTDLYDIVKSKLRLRRNRMQNACNFLGIESKTHPLEADIWQTAVTGNKKSLQWIWDHNVEDVKSTRELWLRLKDYAPISKTSI